VSEALKRVIRAVMRDTRFHKLYPCTVERQDANGLLELTPDDEEIRGTGLAAVPIRHGLPGFTVKVKSGARLLLGFEAGDRKRPYAALWEPGAVEEIVFDGGTNPVACDGDSATVFFPPALVITGGLVGAFPFTGTITITSPGVGLIRANRRLKA
jgi:hypothetical protein